MKAAIFLGPSNIKITDVPEPKIGKDEVLIKVKRIGVCPTDLRYYQGLRGEETFEGIPFTTGPDTFGLSGHEIIGEIVATGENVKHFQKGDQVTHETFTYCGVCNYCQSGLINLCEVKKDIARGYAEYVKVPEKFVYIFDKKVDPVMGAFAEPLSVVIHAVKKIPTKNVIIVGAGPMGLIMALYATYIGKETTVLEINEKRIEFAKSLGLRNVYSPKDDSWREKTKFNSNNLYSSITTVGGKEAIQLALNLASASAPAVIFGGTYPKDTVPIDPNSIHYTEKVLTGSSDHTKEDMLESIKIIEQGAIKLNKLITGEYDLNHLKDAFDNILSGKEMKVQIVVES
ncbi:MAG: alcohol dehydrogenase catalytic domain-containing protein [Candidatus Micrarchaeaceae archaeon]